MTKFMYFQTWRTKQIQNFKVLKKSNFYFHSKIKKTFDSLKMHRIMLMLG